MYRRCSLHFLGAPQPRFCSMSPRYASRRSVDSEAQLFVLESNTVFPPRGGTRVLNIAPLGTSNTPGVLALLAGRLSALGRSGGGRLGNGGLRCRPRERRGVVGELRGCRRRGCSLGGGLHDGCFGLGFGGHLHGGRLGLVGRSRRTLRHGRTAGSGGLGARRGSHRGGLGSGRRGCGDGRLRRRARRRCVSSGGRGGGDGCCRVGVSRLGRQVGLRVRLLATASGRRLLASRLRLSLLHRLLNRRRLLRGGMRRGHAR